MNPSTFELLNRNYEMEAELLSNISPLNQQGFTSAAAGLKNSQSDQNRNYAILRGSVRWFVGATHGVRNPVWENPKTM